MSINSGNTRINIYRSQRKFKIRIKLFETLEKSTIGHDKTTKFDWCIIMHYFLRGFCQLFEESKNEFKFEQVCLSTLKSQALTGK